MARQVKAGQQAIIDTGRGTVSGRVAGVDSAAAREMAVVEVRLDRDPPHEVSPGRSVDGTIHLLTLKDVVYVGGPTQELSELSERTGTIFRLDPDGEHAVRAKVEFGLTGRSTGETRYDKVIEIRSGLQAGDKVILSDMSAFRSRGRVSLQ